MPHSVGHPVGLDVHDPYPMYTHTNVVHGDMFVEQMSLLSDYTLARGHVNTVEPGIYFIPFLLEKAKNSTFGVKQYINWDKVDEWKNVGGVRVEDVIAIDHSGKSVVFTQ
jgi:Xaa-Pro aminopeptidase